jgi:ketosteroid isomerase-like protein
MRKLLVLLGMAALIVPVGAVAGKGNAKDQEAIKEIEVHWQEAWNRHDMKALAALASEDVDFITVAATWLKGRAEFESHHARLHQMQFRDSVWTTAETRARSGTGGGCRMASISREVRASRNGRWSVAIW